MESVGAESGHCDEGVRAAQPFLVVVRRKLLPAVDDGREGHDRGPISDLREHGRSCAVDESTNKSLAGWHAAAYFEQHPKTFWQMRLDLPFIHTMWLGEEQSRTILGPQNTRPHIRQ
eukprot:6199429-Pleurochrysis_carterae.AAC.5